MKILVLEDAPHVYIIMEGAARGRGIVLFPATNYATAVEILAKGDPDLIWCDVELPGAGDGTDILSVVSKEIPAVVCTGYNKPVAGFGRYWKYIDKGKHPSGKFMIAAAELAVYSSRMMLALKQGDSDNKSMTAFRNYDYSFAGHRQEALKRLFLKETECLDAWLSGDREKSATIAAGLLDGSLC